MNDGGNDGTSPEDLMGSNIENDGGFSDIKNDSGSHLPEANCSPDADKMGPDGEKKDRPKVIAKLYRGTGGGSGLPDKIATTGLLFQYRKNKNLGDVEINPDDPLGLDSSESEEEAVTMFLDPKKLKHEGHMTAHSGAAKKKKKRKPGVWYGKRDEQAVMMSLLKNPVTGLPLRERVGPPKGFNHFKNSILEASGNRARVVNCKLTRKN